MSKTVEFHIIHTLPPNCVNRGENGELKTAMYGGTLRQRISSQCWKRAIREEMLKQQCGAKVVSSQLLKLIQDELAKQGCPSKNIVKLSEEIHKIYGKVGNDKLLVHVSPHEIEDMAVFCKDNDWKASKDELISVSKNAKFENDIVMFGRMVAENAELEVEAACSFNHPITVHKIDVESDWYTASADTQLHSSDKGAINLGNKDFGQGTFYKYFAINLDTLLKNIKDQSTVKQILTWKYLKNFCIAVPSAHDNDMNADTRPDYICMVVRDDQPQQISFEKAIRLHDEDESYSELAAKKIEKDLDKWKEASTTISTEPSEFDSILAAML